MTRVEVLVKGYCVLERNGARACSTITLIEDTDLKIIADPGTLSEPALLVNELEKRNLSPGDIDVVFITHSHVDHYRYIGLFQNAVILDYWGRWQGDSWTEFDGVVNENIELIKTPGHSDDSVTLLVKTDRGTIAICGDVFWDKGCPQDDPFAANKELLQESRKKLLKIADYIIPGHGDIFKPGK